MTVTADDCDEAAMIDEIERGLSVVDGAISGRLARMGLPHGPVDMRTADDVPDLLLSTIFDERRSWEIVGVQMEETLSQARVRTLATFLA